MTWEGQTQLQVYLIEATAIWTLKIYKFLQLCQVIHAVCVATENCILSLSGTILRYMLEESPHQEFAPQLQVIDCKV